MAFAVRIGLAIALLACSAIARGDEAAFVTWAASHAMPVRTADAGGEFQDLAPLKDMVGTAHVFALGENMHGAHEPMAFRNRLFECLVEQMGFTAIALESGFTEARLVDSFVGGGPGTAQEVTRNGLTSGFGRLAENRDLVQWIRNYNTSASRQGHRRIRVYGIDLTGGAGRLGGAARTIDYALAYLSEADPSRAQSIRASLGETLPPSDDLQVGALSITALQNFEGALDAIDNAMQMDRGHLIALTSEGEYRFAMHNLEVARQLETYLGLIDEVPDLNAMRNVGNPMQARDRAMAQNVEWIVQNEGPGGRVLVYAHDAHVMNWRLDGGIWAVVRDKPMMMGSYLRGFYGKDLFIMAASSATASAQFPRAEALPGSVDGALARVGLPAMVIDIQRARTDPEAIDWLSGYRPMGANISSHVLINPLTAVDAFLFIKRLTPSRSVPLSGRLLNELDHYRVLVCTLFAALVLAGIALAVQRRRGLLP